MTIRPDKPPQFSVYAVADFPHIDPGDNIVDPIVSTTRSLIQNGDVVCVASKIVSLSENRLVDLTTVTPSPVAKELHAQIPRKDLRTVEVILEQTGEPDGSKVEIVDNWIGGTLPNGLRATSAGVDKFGHDTVILLPTDADASARQIGEAVMEAHGLAKVGVIITDSDGRSDRHGATQIAIGSFGFDPIRRIETTDELGRHDTSEETLCDFISASAGIVMGQRNTGRPVVICRGVDYTFDSTASMARDAFLQ